MSRQRRYTETAAEVAGGALLDVVGAAVIEAEDAQKTDTVDDKDFIDLPKTGQM